MFKWQSKILINANFEQITIGNPTKNSAKVEILTSLSKLSLSQFFFHQEVSAKEINSEYENQPLQMLRTVEI